jgi:hypothetical protein
MADLKISQLTGATTPLAGTEVLPIVQSGVTRQVSVANLTAGRAVSVSDFTYTGTLTGSTGIINIGSGQFYKAANGNVAVGTATPSAGNKFSVVSGFSGGNALNLTTTDATSSFNASCASFLPSTSASGWHLRGILGTTLTVTINANGNLENLNNSYGAISDLKRKENVIDATPKLNSLLQVRVVNYNLKGNSQKQLGVIAQEIEQIFPGLVDKSVDLDADGNDLGTTTKSVKYSVFVPMLIKAIQELKAEFDAYKASQQQNIAA